MDIGNSGTGSVGGNGLRDGILTDLLLGLRVGAGNRDHVVSGNVGVVGVDLGSCGCAAGTSTTRVMMLAMLGD